MDRPKEVSKLNTDCKELAKASYQCTESKPASACQEFFDAYKICRRDEHKRIVDERRNSHANN